MTDVSVRVFRISVNHFQPLLYPLKTSENSRFSDGFREYRSGTLVENGLMKKLHFLQDFLLQKLLTSEIMLTGMFSE